jgi:sterol desaturase/sphingolipid hydroxylase (fatty acid hydroxylase superfamily)
LLIFIGHFVAAIAVYLNHRFVFHGRLGKLPVLRRLKRLHSLHHVHAYDEERNDFFEPLWVRSLFFIVIASIGYLINWGFSFGVLSIHHAYHHKKNPFTNFSGIYPFIDKIFGTMAKQPK